MNNSDARQYAPATQRNREVILEVLRRHLPPTGTVLEIASGTGEHAIFFSPQLAPLCWQPSDTNDVALASIAAWRQYVLKQFPSDRPDLETRLLPPLQLDVTQSPWPVEVGSTSGPSSVSPGDADTTDISAIAAINMIHIAPWAACEGLMAGAERILPSGGVLYLYGPYRRDGQHTAPSNASFDQSLRSRDPSWGVRDLEAVVALADQHQLSLTAVEPMPANNFSVIFHRR